MEEKQKRKKMVMEREEKKAVKPQTRPHQLFTYLPMRLHRGKEPESMATRVRTFLHDEALRRSLLLPCLLLPGPFSFPLFPIPLLFLPLPSSLSSFYFFFFSFMFLFDFIDIN